MSLIRDAPLGQLLRWVTGNRVLLYPEEDPSFALERETREGTPTEKSNSQLNSPCPSSEGLHNSFARKGEESKHVVGWYGDNDSSHPRNWTTWKKRLVALQIWYEFKYTFPFRIKKTPSSTICSSLYTFVVYCGSSIYVPAEP